MSNPNPKTNTKESAKPPSPDERRRETGEQEEHEWRIDEEGIVDEPSDHSDPDFNADLDPTDAP
jgi:hypothetical protein